MESKYGALKLPYIRTALCGIPIQYNAIVPGLPHILPHIYGECLEIGIFLNTIGAATTANTSTANTIETVHEFVPCVSSFQLLLFVTRYIKDPEINVCHPLILCCTFYS
jgi:hypothetical protein